MDLTATIDKLFQEISIEQQKLNQKDMKKSKVKSCFHVHDFIKISRLTLEFSKPSAPIPDGKQYHKWVCLTCGWLGVFLSNDDEGLLKHYREKVAAGRKGHFIMMKIDISETRCLMCHLPIDFHIPIVKEAKNLIIKRFSVQKTSKHIKASTDDIKHSHSLELAVETSKEVESNSLTLYQPPGLKNLGNTCFFNSLVQSLASVPGLSKWLQENTEDFIQYGSLSFAFDKLIRKMWKQPAPVIQPVELFYAICRKWPQYQSKRQQDSHEFLRLLMDGIHSEQKESSLVEEFFGGKLVSLVLCTQCKKVFKTFEPFFDISLPIPGKTETHKIKFRKKKKSRTRSISFRKNSGHTEDDQLSSICHEEEEKEDGIYQAFLSQSFQAPDTVDLRSCLNEFMNIDILYEGNGYNCDLCTKRNGQKTMTKAFKRFMLADLPKNLVLNLKKFQMQSNGKLSKIQSFIPFQMELDVAPWLVPKQFRPKGSHIDSTIYRLFAVVVHLGDIQSGHYIAYVSPQQKEWFYCSDHKERKAATDEVLKSSGYLFFYTQNKA